MPPNGCLAGSRGRAVNSRLQVGCYRRTATTVRPIGATLLQEAAAASSLARSGIEP